MKAIVGKHYRHYKNQKEYIVLAIAYDSDDLKKFVVYEAQYDIEELGAKPVFIRTQKEFEEDVNFKGEVVPRFTVCG